MWRRATLLPGKSKSMPAVADWHKYVIFPEGRNQAFLESWGSLIGDGYQLLFYNLFGDAFLRDTSDRLFVLDVGLGQLVDTECEASEIDQLLSEDETREQWLQCKLVDQLSRSGKRLRKKECYGFSKCPPVLGGEFEPDNLEPILLEVHHSLLSQLHEQARNTPEGTKIEGLEIEEE